MKMNWKITLPLLALSLLSACQGPAVKRGQTTYSKSALPLACLTVGVENQRWPLETIIFTNLKTGEDVSFRFTNSLNPSRPDYPTALEDGNIALSMAIVNLKAGEYSIKKIEFSPIAEGVVVTTQVEFKEGSELKFMVLPDVANYIGTLYISPSSSDLRSVVQPKDEPTNAKFAVRLQTAATQDRDEKWAEDVVPALKSLPSSQSKLMSVGSSVVEGTVKITPTLASDMYWRQRDRIFSESFAKSPPVAPPAPVENVK